MNILEKITLNKRQEITEAKKQISIDQLIQAPLFGKTKISLKGNLNESSLPGIISEFKRKSPSKGTINDQVQPEEVTRGYAAAGAKGLSVLTDEVFFGGSFSDFSQARQANPAIPMLRKDFMVDEYQLYEAKAFGADVILLIAACLTPSELRFLGEKAHDLGMEVLLEVHDKYELQDNIGDHVDMIGVNNRNLKTFVTSIETSVELAELIPDGFVKISESGLKDAQTIVQLFDHGYKGFLIGETFMKTSNPPEALQNLQNELFSLFKHNVISP